MKRQVPLPIPVSGAGQRRPLLSHPFRAKRSGPGGCFVFAVTPAVRGVADSVQVPYPHPPVVIRARVLPIILYQSLAIFDGEQVGAGPPDAWVADAVPNRNRLGLGAIGVTPPVACASIGSC
jgi:hypothetical protein